MGRKFILFCDDSTTALIFREWQIREMGIKKQFYKIGKIVLEYAYTIVRNKLVFRIFSVNVRIKMMRDSTVQ